MLPGNPLARDFLNLIDSFNLVQSVLGPTHVQGHTLDLVLSFGLPVYNLEVCEVYFSDHMPVLFEATVCFNSVKPPAAVRSCRVINPSTAAHFSSAFSQICATTDPAHLDTEALCSQFFHFCQSAIDSAAPLKSRQRKVKPVPWLNETTRSVRQECRRAERKWKKDKLEVSFQILRDCWRRYQSSVKEAKRKYFSDIIVSNCHKPRVLFKVINSTLNASQTVGAEPSPPVCENFLRFFIDKVSSIRALISPSASDPSVFLPCSAVFDSFEPVTLAFVQEIVGGLKPSGSPNDPVPPQLFKEVFPTLGPY